jgi:hypothetical protein
MPAVPLSPVASDDHGDLEDETVPLPHERRQRPQMASGVAAVIYLAAVVLSGALLLYIFDPGLRRDQVPLLSATATHPAAAERAGGQRAARSSNRAGAGAAARDARPHRSCERAARAGAH